MNKVLYSSLLVILSIFYVSAIQAEYLIPIEINNQSDRYLKVYAGEENNDKELFSFNEQAFLNSSLKDGFIYINPKKSVWIGWIDAKESVVKHKESDLSLSILYGITEQKVPYLTSYVAELEITGKMGFDRKTRGLSLKELKGKMIRISGARDEDDSVECIFEKGKYSFEGDKIVINLTNREIEITSQDGMKR